MLAFGTVMGGAGASLTGGNFWQGAATGLVVSGLNHLAHKYTNENNPPNKYKRLFKALRLQFALDYKTNLAVYSITHQWRHLGGPDAVLTSASFSVSPLVIGGGLEAGSIHILYGKNLGQSQKIKAGHLGIFSQGISGTANVVKLYYSGSEMQFNRSGFLAFYGRGYEATGGFGAYGLSGSMSFSYANSTSENFVIGVGTSFGVGTPGFGVGLSGSDTKIRF